MRQKLREREIAGINITSSDASLYDYKYDYNNTVKDELSELKDKIAAIEDSKQPQNKHRRRKISVKVYV